MHFFLRLHICTRFSTSSALLFVVCAISNIVAFVSTFCLAVCGMCSFYWNLLSRVYRFNTSSSLGIRSSCFVSCGISNVVAFVSTFCSAVFGDRFFVLLPDFALWLYFCSFLNRDRCYLVLTYILLTPTLLNIILAR